MNELEKLEKTAKKIRKLLKGIKSLDFDWVELEDLLEELENIWDKEIFLPTVRQEYLLLEKKNLVVIDKTQ